MQKINYQELSDKQLINELLNTKGIRQQDIKEVLISRGYSNKQIQFYLGNS